MAVRRILLLGEEVLRDPGVEVEAFDDELRELVEDMLETMYFAEGIGLAAPQIGVSRRVCVLDLHDEDNPEGEAVEVEADGLLARALQHEIDHLDGILFIDRLSAYKRRALLKKWRKSQKEEAKA